MFWCRNNRNYPKCSLQIPPSLEVWLCNIWTSVYDEWNLIKMVLENWHLPHSSMILHQSKRSLRAMMLFSTKMYWWISYFSTKTYVLGTHQKRLGKALLMSTHNICFCGGIWKKIFVWYSYYLEHVTSKSLVFIYVQRLSFVWGGSVCLFSDVPWEKQHYWKSRPVYTCNSTVLLALFEIFTSTVIPFKEKGLDISCESSVRLRRWFLFHLKN